MSNQKGNSSAPVLDVRDLSVTFHGGEGARAVTHEVSFTVNAGEIVALVGESGSGKTVTGLSVMRLLPDNASVSGSVWLKGRDIAALTPRELRRTLGFDVAAIYQEPLTAMNPVYTVEEHLAEALYAHRDVREVNVDERIDELLNLAQLADTERIRPRYPHELSGGQRQRVMIAMALAWDPALLIADEPTTALDVTTQAEILQLLRADSRRTGMSLLFITHDMGVVADIADRVLVMHQGRLVEEGDVDSVFYRPRDPYTQQLLDAVAFRKEALQGHVGGAAIASEPSAEVGAEQAIIGELGRQGLVQQPVRPDPGEVLLAIRDLGVVYPAKDGGIRHNKGFRALESVDFDIAPGEILGLVGESGSGKSTVAKALLGVAPNVSGSISLRGEELIGAREKQRRRIARGVGAIFQDPGASLNPRAKLWRSVTEPLWRHGIEKSRRTLRSRAAELLDVVAIPGDWLDRYPHQLSGGQRQRVCIARALALRPSLLIADEPTSALDVSVQATVLQLLTDLQRELGFACLFISHDLFTVAALCDRVAVMKSGEIVEIGDTSEILNDPRNDYTQRLLAAAPIPDPAIQRQRRDASLLRPAGA